MVRLFLFFSFFIITTLSFSQGFVVDDYHVDVFLNKAGYFDVVEKYEINFTESKHGIYRNIITKYKLDEGDGQIIDRKISIGNIKVPTQRFKVSNKIQSKIDGKVEIKIGNENKTVKGKQSYTIKYRVNNAFLFNDSNSQFYWNLKSSDWNTVFNHISFAIHLPDNLPLKPQNYFLYSGTTGSTGVDESIPLVYFNGVLSGNSKSDLQLPGRGNNITILIKMPADYIEKPSSLWPIWQRWGWLSWLVIIVATYYYVWLNYGKDSYLLDVVHYFPPVGLDPAMAGYLINDQEDARDLISLIPYWGAAGLLSLEEISKKGLFGSSDTLLKKLKDLPSNASSYERVMFNGLFPESKSEVLVSSLKNTFYTTMNSAKTLLKKEARRYYNQTADTLRTAMFAFLIIMAIVGLYFSILYWTILGGIVIVVVCVILLFNNKIMKKRSKQGDDVLAEVNGFRMFVKTAEEEKLRILLLEDPSYFEKSLSFALTFGMLKKWGSKFNKLDVANPSWYHSTSGSAFSAQSFSNSFSSSMGSLSSTMVSSPSSSGTGGGSSGGGFGGGGGGSW